MRDIERALGVARSSVSRWVRDVEVAEDRRQALVARVSEGRLRVAREKADAARAVRAAYQSEGLRLARESDAPYAAGCMLYWAEGSKARNDVSISNADPQLLRFFATFLRTHFAVPDEDFRVSCNLFTDHVARQEEIERFWLETLRLPPSCLRKSTVNVYSKYSAKKRTNKLPYGTAHLRVYSTRIVQTIYGSIQEYGGFERAAWLD